MGEKIVIWFYSLRLTDGSAALPLLAGSDGPVVLIRSTARSSIGDRMSSDSFFNPVAALAAHVRSAARVHSHRLGDPNE